MIIEGLVAITIAELIAAMNLAASVRKYRAERTEYDRVLEESESHRSNLQRALESLGDRVLSTQIELLRAHRILEPLARHRRKFSFRPTEPASPTQVAAFYR